MSEKEEKKVETQWEKKHDDVKIKPFKKTESRWEETHEEGLEKKEKSKPAEARWEKEGQ